MPPETFIPKNQHVFGISIAHNEFHSKRTLWRARIVLEYSAALDKALPTPPFPTDISSIEPN